MAAYAKAVDENTYLLRILPHLMVCVKGRAIKLDVPYQSLMKQYIAQGVLKK